MSEDLNCDIEDRVNKHIAQIDRDTEEYLQELLFKHAGGILVEEDWMLYRQDGHNYCFVVTYQGSVVGMYHVEVTVKGVPSELWHTSAECCSGIYKRLKDQEETRWS